MCGVEPKRGRQHARTLLEQLPRIGGAALLGDLLGNLIGPRGQRARLLQRRFDFAQFLIEARPFFGKCRVLGRRVLGGRRPELLQALLDLGEFRLEIGDPTMQFVPCRAECPPEVVERLRAQPLALECHLHALEQQPDGVEPGRVAIGPRFGGGRHEQDKRREQNGGGHPDEAAGGQAVHRCRSPGSLPCRAPRRALSRHAFRGSKSLIQMHKSGQPGNRSGLA